MTTTRRQFPEHDDRYEPPGINDVHGFTGDVAQDEEVIETRGGKIKHQLNWMATVGDRHVALFHKDGKVELFPENGDAIVVETTPEFTDLLEGLETLEACAFQFERLADYVGGLIFEAG